MATKKIVSNLDLSGNTLSNVVLEVRKTDPENPKVGQIYFNSDFETLRVFAGEKWVNLKK